MNSVFNLRDGQVMFSEEWTVKSILLLKTLSVLVEMMAGLVNASFSLPVWQALKMIFFARWIIVGLLFWYKKNGVWTFLGFWGVGGGVRKFY